MLATTTITVGALLGLKFKIIVLVPAHAFAIVTLAGRGLLHGDGIGAILLAIIVSATGLQMGYLIGVVIGFLLAATRFPKKLAGAVAEKIAH